MSTERDRALSTALGQIERSYGKGAIMRLGAAEAQRNVEAIPTGALTLDIALGVGGVPRGRVVEIYGPESSGKTTLTLHIIAEAQKRGGVAAFIDAEHALDPQYAGRIGVKTEELLISQPDTGEQALEIVEVLVRSGAVDVIVIDSVAALVPKAEIDGEMGDTHVGLQARLMSQAMRKLTAAISRSNASVIFINQLREKVGVMFGNPEVTTGGRALKFYASVRMDIRKIDSIKQGLDVVGSRVKVKVVKNKVAPPFRAAEFDILYDEGISYAGSVLDVALETRIVEKSGAWFSYGDMRLGQGRENVRDFLRQNPDLLAEITQRVRASLLPAEPGAAASGTATTTDTPTANGTAPATPAPTAGRVSGGGSGPSPLVADDGPERHQGDARAEHPEDDEAVEEQPLREEAAEHRAEGAAPGEGDGVEGHERGAVGGEALRAVGEVGDRGRAEAGDAEHPERGDREERRGGGEREVVHEQRPRADEVDAGHGADHRGRSSAAAQHRRPDHDADDEEQHPAEQDAGDRPVVESVDQGLRGVARLAEQRGEVEVPAADEGVHREPGGDEDPDRPRPGDHPHDHRHRAHR